MYVSHGIIMNHIEHGMTCHIACVTWHNMSIVGWFTSHIARVCSQTRQCQDTHGAGCYQYSRDNSLMIGRAVEGSYAGILPYFVSTLVLHCVL